MWWSVIKRKVPRCEKTVVSSSIDPSRKRRISLEVTRAPWDLSNVADGEALAFKRCQGYPTML